MRDGAEAVIQDAPVKRVWRLVALWTHEFAPFCGQAVVGLHADGSAGDAKKGEIARAVREQNG